MSQDMGGVSKGSLAARPSLLGRLAIPAAVLVAIVLSLCNFNISRTPTPVAGAFAAIQKSAVVAQMFYAPAKQHAKVLRAIDADLGRIAIPMAHGEPPLLGFSVYGPFA